MVSKVLQLAVAFLLLNFDFQSLDLFNLLLTENKAIFISVNREQYNLIKNT